MGEEYIAHLKQQENSIEWVFHMLEEHLEGTAKLAEKFADKFYDGRWGRLLGLWHDLGKYSQEFQAYIRKNSGFDESLTDARRTDHTTAGAIYARDFFKKNGFPKGPAKLLSYAIAGHHSGLLNWVNEIGVSGDLSSRFDKLECIERVQGAIDSLPLQKIPEFNPCNGRLASPPDQTQIRFHLWVRMLFSCLVDADFLDTESFMSREQAELRGGHATIQQLHEKFSEYMKTLTAGARVSEVNKIRDEILESCISHGTERSGFFSITVPTGGGKTLSSMAWALEHAIKHKKDRVIVAIPYTSIITQTAQIFRGIFGEENVIEHHSDIDEETNDKKRKLATENWDAPIVVTTNVQLFESLFANKTSRCRKLHNIVNSVLILDEAQVLPPEFLNPILKTLKTLVNCFDVSVLLSSATQPALIGTIGSGQYRFKGLDKSDVIEIASDAVKLSKDLKRVELSVQHTGSEPIQWADLAAEIKKHKQVLCIVNTRKDCKDLYNLLPKGTIHLSRMMCSSHIADTIKEIKSALKNEKPVCVVSTQLIEAGVDIDFPIVYRAYAGLDSVAQSAGRCNREGILNKSGGFGQVTVFISPNPAPVGFIRKGCDALTEVVHTAPVDYLSPDLFTKYFKIFYGKVNGFDKADIRGKLENDAAELKFQFGTAARDFKLIAEDGSVQVVVWYGEGKKWIDLLKRKGPERWLFRKLQRYTVSLREKDFKRCVVDGRIEQFEGVWMQVDDCLYDIKSGFTLGDEWCDETLIG